MFFVVAIADESRVIAVALYAFQVDEVKLGDTSDVAIVASDFHLAISEFFWEWLLFDCLVDLSIIGRHIGESFSANGAHIISGGVGIEAAMVHGVAALHEDDLCGAGEHVVAADGAVCVQRCSQASMCVLSVGFQRYACVAMVAMVVVSPETLSDAAYLALIAVVDLFPGRVVEESAVVAVIIGEFHPARFVAAILGYVLLGVAHHAEYTLYLEPIDGMMGSNTRDIMTSPAYDPHPATGRLYLAVTRVVHAAQQLISLGILILRVGQRVLVSLAFRCVRYRLAVLLPRIFARVQTLARSIALARRQRGVGRDGDDVGAQVVRRRFRRGALFRYPCSAVNMQRVLRQHRLI